MATFELAVYMDGVRAGRLEQNAHGRSTFTYDEQYLSSSAPTPLSMSLPLLPGPAGSKPTDAFFAGLLPDNPETLKAWGLKYGVSPNNILALLQNVGRDTAGALQILPLHVAADDAIQRGERIAWLDDDQLRELIKGLKANNTNWDAMRSTGRWSLAGAQSKVALFHDGERWGTPLDSTPTTHILKPTIPGFEAHDINEYMCMEVAGRLGLPAARTEILTVGEERILVSTRYDRVKIGDRWSRIHQEDLCQALGVPPSKKYQVDGGPSVKQIARLLKTIQPDPAESTSRMFDYLNYNIAIGATDAHAKNYSLVHSGASTTLSPLYDVASFLPYDRALEPPSAGLKYEPAMSAMKMGRHWELADIDENDMAEIGKTLGISRADSIERYRDLRRRLPGLFHTLATEVEGNALGDGMARRLAELVERNVGGRLPSKTPQPRDEQPRYANGTAKGAQNARPDPHG